MIYTDFISQLNSSIIKCMSFEISCYPHYSNCKIFRQNDILKNGAQISIIVCKLTEDDSENVSFLNEFKEDYKLFNFGRKGKFTLKQLWDKVCIKEIKFSNQNI